MEITKEQFKSYESVRKNGVTNMFAISTVCEISGLTKEQAKEIMKSYSELSEKYPGVVE